MKLIIGDCFSIWLINLMMSSKSSKIKLGGFNLTFCFDQPRSRWHFQREMKHSSPKEQLMTSLTARKDQLHQKHYFAGSKRLNLYQRSKNESIRYLQDENQTLKSNFQKTVELPTHRNLTMLQVDQKYPAQQHPQKVQNHVREDSLKLRHAKKHLRNTNINQDQERSSDKIIILNLKSDPEQNLRNAFTVHTAHTSQRIRLRSSNRQRDSRKKLRMRLPPTSHYSRNKSKCEVQQKEPKFLSPWVTSKAYEAKFNTFQFDIFQPNPPKFTFAN